MMNDVIRNSVVKAIDVRIKRGETIEDILVSYPKLTDEEKNDLRELFKENK